MVRLKTRKGFTIIEVSLVLAISALVTVGVMVGVTASVARQRYNDSVNDVVDYLRSTYSEATNIQNFRESDSSGNTSCSISAMFDGAGNLAFYDNSGNKVSRDKAADIGFGAGRTNCAIYGRLITFGETSVDNENTIDAELIHSYDIIGRVYTDNLEAAEDKAALSKVGADAVSVAKVNSTMCSLAPAGSYSSHRTQWGAQLQTTSSAQNGQFTPFRGAIAIIRSPISGSIHTYAIDYNGSAGTKPIDISHAVATAEQGSANADGSCMGSVISSMFGSKRSDFFAQLLKDEQFTNDQEITLCVGSDDVTDGSRRRAVRILANGHNSTAVKLLNLDASEGEEGSPCQ